MPESQRIMVDSAQYIKVPIRERDPKISQKDWDSLAKINDRIAFKILYDESRAKTSGALWVQSPDETIERRKGICMDFAAVFEVLARKMGYRVRSVISSELDHAWNEVNIGGVWWIVDTSWNSPGKIFEGKSQRNNTHLLRRYFLTTVDEELVLEKKNLLSQTHACTDAMYVNYEKTIEAQRLLRVVNKLIIQYNKMALEQHRLVKRYNKNISKLNYMTQEFNLLIDSDERYFLHRRLNEGREIIENQKNDLQKLNAQLADFRQKINKMKNEIDKLQKNYPLAVNLGREQRPLNIERLIQKSHPQPKTPTPAPPQTPAHTTPTAA